MTDRSSPAHDPKLGGVGTPAAEWVVGGLGFVMVAGVVGHLIHAGVTMRSAPAELQVTVERIRPGSQGHWVHLRLGNPGGTTAAEAVAEGVLSDGAALETSEVTIDYVPPHSERKAVLFFRNDPRQHRLEVRALGYREP